MFPFPDPPSTPSGPRRAPGIDPGERGRFIVLGVGLLFVLGLLGGAYVLATRGGGTATKPPGPPAGGAKGGVEPIIEWKPEPLFPEEEGQEVEARLRERLAAFREIVDGVPAVDPAPFGLLLEEVTSNARVMNLQREAFDRKPDLAAILGNPAAHRGRLVSVSGPLLSLDREPWTTPSGLVKEVRRGVIRSGADGPLVSFAWPVGNPLEPDPVSPGDGWAQVQGIFYKAWPVKDPTSGAETRTPHLVLQRRPSRDYPPVQVRDLDAAWLGQIRDSTPAEMAVRDEDPLYLLANMAGTLGPAGFESWAKVKQAADPALKLWPPVDMTGKYKELLDKPDLYRLRPVSYSGFLVKPQVLTDLRPNPGNVERLWISFLVDQDFAPAVWVYTPWSPVEKGLRSMDRVKVEGIFVKRVVYEPGTGGPMMRAAVVVASRITPAPLGSQPWGTGVLVAIIVLMAILAGGLVWAIVQGRRSEEEARRRRQEKAAKKRAAAPAVAPPPADGPR